MTHIYTLRARDGIPDRVIFCPGYLTKATATGREFKDTLKECGVNKYGAAQTELESLRMKALSVYLAREILYRQFGGSGTSLSMKYISYSDVVGFQIILS